MDNSKDEKQLHFRNLCLDELLSSEESYLHHLSLLDEFFINPIIEKRFLPTTLFNSIFGNVTPILALNSRLHEELRRHHSTDTIGQGFLIISPYLKIYANYAKNLEQAQLRLTNFEAKNKEFKKFRENQECRPELCGLKLNSLLITPVQRVPRYRLLLHEIINYTSKTHQDYKNLIDAEKAIGDVALHINSHVRQTADIQTMLTVQRALVNGRPCIFTPGRHLIKFGPVKKLSKHGNGEQRRVLILFNDMIMYCKEKLNDFKKPDSLQCCCILPLSDCNVTPLFGVIFKVHFGDEDILFYAPSSCDCQIWVDKIKDAIVKNNEKEKTLKKSESNKLPVNRKRLIRGRINSLSRIMKDRTRKRLKASPVDKPTCDNSNTQKQPLNTTQIQNDDKESVKTANQKDVSSKCDHLKNPIKDTMSSCHTAMCQNRNQCSNPAEIKHQVHNLKNNFRNSTDILANILSCSIL